jgi:hypothetical protein
MRCRRWLVASCFILASTVGCSPTEESAPPAAAAATQPAPISPEEQQAILRSEHDEPVVIDNAPMKISLSKYATATSGGYEWTRHFDRFATLHIVPREANGDPAGNDITYRLCYECSVFLLMKENGNQPAGTEEAIELKPDKTAHKLTMKPEREYAQGNNKRLTPKNSPQLRLVGIRFTNRDTNVEQTESLVDGNAYKYKNVEIILIGTAP